MDSDQRLNRQCTDKLLSDDLLLHTKACVHCHVYLSIPSLHHYHLPPSPLPSLHIDDSPGCCRCCVCLPVYDVPGCLDKPERKYIRWSWEHKQKLARTMTHHLRCRVLVWSRRRTTSPLTPTATPPAALPLSRERLCHAPLLMLT